MSLSRIDFIRSSLAASACVLGASAASAQTSPADIVVADANIFPESIGYAAATKQFYVGSLRYGRVTAVDMSGNAKPFSAIDPAYSSIFGIFTDASRGLVYGCATDIGLGVASSPAMVGRVARLVGFDVHSGRVVRNIDLVGSLPGKHLPNDGAIASDGSIYVTNTTSPIVFRVSPDGKSEVFARDDGFMPPAAPGGGGLDGIAIASSGTIVVNHFSNGTFFRIDPATRAVVRVATPSGRTFPGADGMRFLPNGKLVLSQSLLGGSAAQNAIVVLTTSDDWHTAQVANEYPLTKTTYQSVTTPSGAFGIQGHLEEIFKDPKTASAPTFTIVGLPGAVA